MSKYIQISILTRKRLWWCAFKYSRCCEGLQPYDKITLSQMLSCKTCEVLKKTVGRLLLISKNILDLLLVLSAKKSINCLGPPETAVHKRLTVFALKIFKDNQNIAKAKSNILLVKPQTRHKTQIERPSYVRSIYVLCLRGRSMHQRKWVVFSRSIHYPNIFRKKEFCDIRQTHWKTSLVEPFFQAFGLQL